MSELPAGSTVLCLKPGLDQNGKVCVTPFESQTALGRETALLCLKPGADQKGQV
jgi:hypothetical protein